MLNVNWNFNVVKSILMWQKLEKFMLSFYIVDIKITQSQIVYKNVCLLYNHNSWNKSIFSPFYVQTSSIQLMTMSIKLPLI